jgi:signal transduction histidine kinase
MMHIANSAILLVKEEVESRENSAVRFDRLVEDTVIELDMIGHHVELGRMEPATITGGPHAIKRAISNLLVNACTHGDKAKVCVYVEDGKAVCAISDEGPGIPEDMIQHAFEPFFRADKARQRITTGAGLGLAIVKEIIQRHKGTITLSNRRPTGLHQEVTFPAVEEA